MKHSKKAFYILNAKNFNFSFLKHLKSSKIRTLGEKARQNKDVLTMMYRVLI